MSINCILLFYWIFIIVSYCRKNLIVNVRSGGWWEGTLDGKTGWFPSNYVEDIPRLVRMEAIVLNVQSIGREIV